jgi:MtaA/CmuA family methyltransferase
MNGRERMLAAIYMEPTDQVPLAPPFQGYWALGVMKVKGPDAIKNPKMAAQAQIDIAERCHFDALETMWDWLSPVEALGCQVKIPDLGAIPTWTNILSDDTEKLSTLQVPDPSKDYRLVSSLETTEIMRKALGKEKFLYNTLVCPYTLAGELRGVETMMLDSLLEPEFLPKLLRFSTDVVREYCEHLTGFELDGVFICDPTASGSLISKEDYAKSSQPAQKECAAVINQGGKFTLLHMCGDTSDRLEHVMDVRSAIFSMDYQVPLQKARDQLVGKQAFLGNVKPAHTLYSGTPQMVLEESKQCIRDGGDVGFILGAGCDVAPDTPLENVLVWNDVVKMSL